MKSGECHNRRLDIELLVLIFAAIEEKPIGLHQIHASTKGCLRCKRLVRVRSDPIQDEWTKYVHYLDQYNPPPM